MSEENIKMFNPLYAPIVNFVIKYFVDSKDNFKLNIIVYKIL